MAIPIENIYYLLCYAWNQLDQKDQVSVAVDDKATIVDLLATVLINGTKVLLKRGIDKSYNNQVEELAAIRGKLLLSETAKRGLHMKQRAVCSFDEYSSDTLLNQLLVSTLYRLLNIQNLDSRLKGEVKQLTWMLPDVTLLEVKRSHFTGVRFHRNNRFYGFLLNVCQLIWESCLPSEKAGEWKFMDFTRDEGKMNQLFEAFIRNFYHREQSLYQVRRETIEWQLSPLKEADKKFLPQMHTDITLESVDKKIIIDAKYYKETMAVRFDSEKIKSVNLYQLFSYLLHQRKGDEKTERAKGVLLYPTISQEYNLHYTYQNHDLYIKTLNLNEKWQLIAARLKSILSEL